MDKKKIKILCYVDDVITILIAENQDGLQQLTRIFDYWETVVQHDHLSRRN